MYGQYVHFLAIFKHKSRQFVHTRFPFFSQIPNFLMSQVRRLNENSNRRYQFYDRRIKNLLRKIHTDSREKPTKNNSDVSVENSKLEAASFRASLS